MATTAKPKPAPRPKAVAHAPDADGLSSLDWIVVLVGLAVLAAIAYRLMSEHREQQQQPNEETFDESP